MKYSLSKLSLFLVCIFCLTLSCKDEMPPVIPVNQLILGLWKQIEARESGFVVPLDEYRTLEFMADKSVIIKTFDVDDIEINNTMDTWDLVDNNSKVDFDVADDMEIVSITQTALTFKFMGLGQTGPNVEIQEDYSKQ